MLGTIYFLKNFNNYYNRCLIKYDSIDEYKSYYVGTLQNVNFNQNDGINTKVDQLVETPFADYLLYTENNTIISRWFVIETKRLTSGLFELTLRRDVIADNWDNIQTAPMRIERAIVPQDSSLIYNQEAFSCNEVKTSEQLLYDETNTAWIVGYFGKKDEETKGSYAEQEISFDANVVSDYTATSLRDWDKYYLMGSWYTRNETVIRFTLYNSGGLSDIVEISKDDVKIVGKSIYEDYFWKTNDGATFFIQQLKAVDGLYDTLMAYCNPYITDIDRYNYTNFNDALELNGKILAVSNNDYEYYTITAIKGLTHNSYSIDSDKATGYVLSYLKEVLQKLPTYHASSGSFGTKYPYYRISCGESYCMALLNQQGTFTCKIQDSRFTLKDAPYDMFIMPYGDVTWKNGGISCEYTKQTAMSMAQGIAEKLGSFLYDIQIVPYCPATGFIITTDENEHTTIDINSLDARRCTYIYSGENVKGILCWCTASSGTKIINKQLIAEDFKVDNCCRKYRLSGSNYSASFDFSVAKNKGVSGFNVSYSYVPYSPYIRVAPIFNGLYGKEFSDGRGLIDQGDHSITYTSDAWTQYQINNKNYLNAFNRQIENMDVQQSVNRINNIVGGVAGIASGAVQGGMAFGTAGAVVGGIASAAGMAGDIITNEVLYNENKAYAKDQFNYQLDNVKALPDTLAKVIAYTPDNKIVPVLEIYEPTTDDLIAFCNLIKYTSMTVGVIGKIADYVNINWTHVVEGKGFTDKGFIKAVPLQLYNLSDDYHMATTIADELKLGIYIKP